jgi:hypothetical protein
MIKTFKLFELTMQQFSRQFQKERDDSVDKNIPEIKSDDNKNFESENIYMDA